MDSTFYFSLSINICVLCMSVQRYLTIEQMCYHKTVAGTHLPLW